MMIRPQMNPVRLAILDPGNSITCTASYTVTQADLDSGSVTNTAFATGADPGGNPVASAPDTVTVPAAQTPGIQIVKTMASYGDLDGSNSITLGDELWYRFNVSNTGNVTLNPVSVTDDSFGIPVTCPGTILAPGASTLCAADAAHTITLAEANAGQVSNTATAIGELNGTPYTASDTITTPISQNPALALTKSAVPGELRYRRAGHHLHLHHRKLRGCYARRAVYSYRRQTGNADGLRHWPAGPRHNNHLHFHTHHHPGGYRCREHHQYRHGFGQQSHLRAGQRDGKRSPEPGAHAHQERQPADLRLGRAGYHLHLRFAKQRQCHAQWAVQHHRR